MASAIERSVGEMKAPLAALLHVLRVDPTTGQRRPPAPVVGSTRKTRRNAASADGNGKDHNACGIHTLHFPHYAATLPPP
jgi:hypothetical protein